MSNRKVFALVLIPLMREKVNGFMGFSFLLDNNSSLTFSQFKGI